MTADELKTMNKGSFIVMKTGTHPFIAKLKLFKEWGIEFDTKPYTVADKGARRVSYTSRQIIENGIMGFAATPRKEAQKKTSTDDDTMNEQNDPTPHGTVRTPQESE